VPNLRSPELKRQPTLDAKLVETAQAAAKLRQRCSRVVKSHAASSKEPLTAAWRSHLERSHPTQSMVLSRYGGRPASFDHLIGSGEEHGRDREVERFGGS
jgi:hypothetical protein